MVRLHVRRSEKRGRAIAAYLFPILYMSDTADMMLAMGRSCLKESNWSSSTRRDRAAVSTSCGAETSPVFPGIPASSVPDATQIRATLRNPTIWRRNLRSASSRTEVKSGFLRS